MSRACALSQAANVLRPDHDRDVKMQVIRRVDVEVGTPSQTGGVDFLQEHFGETAKVTRVMQAAPVGLVRRSQDDT